MPLLRYISVKASFLACSSVVPLASELLTFPTISLELLSTADAEFIVPEVDNPIATETVPTANFLIENFLFIYLLSPLFLLNCYLLLYD